MFKGIRQALIIAPHMDDEVLGCGGTIARLADAGAEVQVAVVTVGRPPRFDPALEDQCRIEACAAHAILGVTESPRASVCSASARSPGMPSTQTVYKWQNTDAEFGRKLEQAIRQGRAPPSRLTRRSTELAAAESTTGPRLLPNGERSL